MFDITQKNCLLRNVNGRHEKHGDENVLAADIEFDGDFTGDILAEFSPSLRSMMYEMAPDGDLADQGSDTPTKLRIPNLCMPIKFDNEVVGADITIPYGTGDITFQTADINKFRVTCHEGGTVSVAFRVQVKPSQDQLAKLFALLDTVVAVSVVPPELKE